MTGSETVSWEAKSQKYREAAAAKIPEAWRLPREMTTGLGPTSNRGVLDIPRKCGILTERELDLTEHYDVVSLVEMLSNGTVSSLEVTTAFCKRAAIAQQLTCCLTETLFDEALERAKYCDEYLASKKKVLGPFHGLPVSVKDSFNIKGIQATIGFISFLDHPLASENAALVNILLDQGAVLYVKTNIPQTLMTADSENNLFGRCLNPQKLSLTSGGSSGGEGALLAMRGSPFGVGTDIAGSIRIPAYCNGTFGLRPTARRIPYSGQASGARAGTFGILPAAGPLARSVRDIEYFMKSILSYDVWTVDEAVISVPWRDIAAQPKANNLKLGFLTEDPARPLHPPVLRTFQDALTKLQDAGHTVVDLAPHLPADILSQVVKTSWTMFGMDPTKTGLSHLKASGERIVDSIPTARLPELDDWKPSLDDVYRTNVERLQIGRLFRQAFVKNELDAVVTPVFQTSAPPHDSFGVPYYTILANFLDMPAISLPYGNADKAQDAEFKREVKYIPPYDPDAVEGAICGIQIMGRPMKDEELVGCAQTVTDVLGAKMVEIPG